MHFWCKSQLDFLTYRRRDCVISATNWSWYQSRRVPWTCNEDPSILVRQKSTNGHNWKLSQQNWDSNVNGLLSNGHNWQVHWLSTWCITTTDTLSLQAQIESTNDVKFTTGRVEVNQSGQVLLITALTPPWNSSFALHLAPLECCALSLLCLEWL